MGANKDTDRFFAGEEVSEIYWPDGSRIAAGINGVTKIVVVMEYGQMAAVPWFAVWDDHKIISKHNGAHIESVIL